MEHVFETKIQELKTQVLTEVARLAWEDRLQTGILDVPEKIIPAPPPACAAASTRSGPSSTAG